MTLYAWSFELVMYCVRLLLIYLDSPVPNYRKHGIRASHGFGACYDPDFSDVLHDTYLEQFLWKMCCISLIQRGKTL